MYHVIYKWKDGYEPDFKKMIKTGELYMWKKENESEEEYLNRIEERKNYMFGTGLLHDYQEIIK